jgi:hypothetical protein
VAAAGLTIALFALTALEPPPEAAKIPPRESPLYGPPHRHGLSFEVAVGLSLCQPAILYGGVCVRRDGSPPAPGLALRLGAGWRFGPHLLLSGAWVRQGHQPGGSFDGGNADGGIAALRGIVPLAARGGRDSHLDLGFELGLGWSRRVSTRSAAPTVLSSSGALVRPAIVFEGWVLADLAIGVELASHLNFHWQHCVEAECRPAPGPWVTAGLEQRWVDGFTIAVRATGLVFFRP